MAELSCLEAIKNRESRMPTTKDSECSSLRLPRRVRVPTKQMYEIELVETEKERVKIHYVGFSHKYDEWKLKSEIKHQQPPVNRGEVPEFSFFTELLGKVKSKLVPSRKEDPSVRLQIPFDKDLFHSTLAVSGTRVQDCWQKIVYTIARYNVLNKYLGENWHLRVNNVYGDFSYAVLDIVRYHLHRVKPLLDFDVSQQHDQLAFIPVYIEQGYHLVFSFVRRDGNACKLKQMLC